MMRPYEITVPQGWTLYNLTRNRLPTDTLSLIELCCYTNLTATTNDEIKSAFHAHGGTDTLLLPDKPQTAQDQQDGIFRKTITYLPTSVVQSESNDLPYKLSLSLGQSPFTLEMLTEMLLSLSLLGKPLAEKFTLSIARNPNEACAYLATDSKSLQEKFFSLQGQTCVLNTGSGIRLYYGTSAAIQHRMSCQENTTTNSAAVSWTVPQSQGPSVQGTSNTLFFAADPSTTSPATQPHTRLGH